jgi:hypothetical protein
MISRVMERVSKLPSTLPRQAWGGQQLECGLSLVWHRAGLVPGVICLLSVPLILYVIYPPEVKDTPDAPAKARHARC